MTATATRQRICWFDIAVSSIDNVRSFYAPLFGWELTQMTDSYWYVDSTDNSIGGGFYISPEDAGPSATTLYVSVPSLRESCERAVELGGTVVTEPSTLPGDAGAFAQVADLDGNTIGLWADSV
jgi:uncharacterized protein